MKFLARTVYGLAVANLLSVSAPAAVTPPAAGASNVVSAPIWLSGLRWVNVRPISAADLRGKVVVVEFWTFDCVNCRRTVPAMRTLAGSYRAAQDVVVIGIHTPELDHERRFDNVRRAVDRLGLRFPVAQDNDYTAWRAFDNHYWPALYVIDRSGAIRTRHIGELHFGTPAWKALIGNIEALRSRAS
jgi:thiol-disulfide isomerase/thioredoxin